jgi:hypothetical protein
LPLSQHQVHYFYPHVVANQLLPAKLLLQQKHLLQQNSQHQVLV